MNTPEKLLDLIFNPTKTPKKWDAVDKVEGFIATLPRQNGDIIQMSTPGLYIREIMMPKGTLITSKIHKMKHPFHISEGSVVVYNTLDDSTELHIAPYDGITLPLTRRVLYTFEDTKWRIFIPTPLIKENFDDLSEREQNIIFDEIVDSITVKYDNPEIVGFDDGVFI